MVTFGAKLPNVLNAMLREAEAGNVQAGRLILEHSGKLIKRVEVANHKSPFEKFLTSEVADIQEVEVLDADFEDTIEVLPKRPEVVKAPKKMTQIEEKRQLKKVLNKNEKRRDARQWRIRAEQVGIDKPSQGRQTKAQREAWQQKVINREKALNIRN
tara:strand:- start:445 stop:915 length:471 start_codon:yes stop_codon:yes gene_type:complete